MKDNKRIKGDDVQVRDKNEIYSAVENTNFILSSYLTMPYLLANSSFTASLQKLRYGIYA